MEGGPGPAKGTRTLGQPLDAHWLQYWDATGSLLPASQKAQISATPQDLMHFSGFLMGFETFVNFFFSYLIPAGDPSKPEARAPWKRVLWTEGPRPSKQCWPAERSTSHGSPPRGKFYGLGAFPT